MAKVWKTEKEEKGKEEEKKEEEGCFVEGEVHCHPDD